MASWNDYFQFDPGTRFSIDGPWGYDGHGAVLEKTGNKLVLRIDIPAWGPAPDFKAVVTIEYRQEGPGNTVVLEPQDGASSRDDNAVVQSNDSRRERSISSRDITFSIRHESDDEVDFDVNLNGHSFDFDFERE